MTYDEWKTDAGDDDPDGTAADARDLTDDIAEHPERYGGIANTPADGQRARLASANVASTAAVADPFEVPFAMPEERVNVCDCEACK